MFAKTSLTTNSTIVNRFICNKFKWHKSWCICQPSLRNLPGHVFCLCQEFNRLATNFTQPAASDPNILIRICILQNAYLTHATETLCGSSAYSENFRQATTLSPYSSKHSHSAPHSVLHILFLEYKHPRCQ